MDWWSPLIAAASGLGGVWLGAGLTSQRERRQRALDFARRQLDEFYAPMLALRQEVRAKAEVRVGVSTAFDKHVQASIAGVTPPNQVRILGEKQLYLEATVAYNNAQLVKELIPAYQRMLTIFQEKHSLAEASTQAHYGKLVEFVEIWRRYLDKSIPSMLPEEMGHDESKLLGELYRDVETWANRLRARIAAGRF